MSRGAEFARRDRMKLIPSPSNQLWMVACSLLFVVACADVTNDDGTESDETALSGVSTEFTSTSLASPWVWSNPHNYASYSLTAKSGHLRITIPAGWIQPNC